MNPNAVLEGRLESLGVMLRARPRVTARVMDEVRGLAESTRADSTEGVKVRANHLAVAPVSPSRMFDSRNRRWRTSRFIIVGLTAAAALLAMVIGGLSLLDHSGGRVFAQMIEKVNAAGSVHFTTAQQFGNGPKIKGAMYLEGNRMRCEQFNGMLVNVGDFERKRALALNVPGKLAQQVEMDTHFARAFNNPIDQLRRAKANDAEQIGEEILKGRRTKVYRFRKVDLLFFKGDGEMLLWVDLESELPAKIVIRDRDPKSPMEFRFEDFVWNEPLDARLFSLAIPDGFQMGRVVEVPKRPTETKATSAVNPNYLADGALSRDLVPAQILWDPNGKTITALMRDPESVPPQQQRPEELRHWDVATGKLRWKTVDGFRELAGTVDGKTLATVINFEVQLRDAASGNVTRKWATDEFLSGMSFSPDGKILAAGIAEWGKYGGRGGQERGGVQIWDVERAGLLRSLSDPDEKPTQFVKYSVDGKYLATSTGPSVKLWDAATGELARIFPGIHTAAFSPDGRSIACQSARSSDEKAAGRVDLYNLLDGSLVKSFLSEKGAAKSWVTCIAFSPDGHLLAAADWDGIVTVWDVTSGQRKLTITDHRAGVVSLAFSPDGATLATGSEDQTLRLRKLPDELIQPTLEKW